MASESHRENEFDDIETILWIIRWNFHVPSSSHSWLSLNRQRCFACASVSQRPLHNVDTSQMSTFPRRRSGDVGKRFRVVYEILVRVRDLLGRNVVCLDWFQWGKVTCVRQCCSRDLQFIYRKIDKNSGGFIIFLRPVYRIRFRTYPFPIHIK